MTDHQVYLVAGLGNPGPAYENTRHNAGFLVIDALADQYDIRVDRRKFDVLFGRGRMRGHEVLLAKPQAYMNRSGPPLRALCDYFRIQREAVVIVHDDIDLAFTRLKIKEKGGDGGHKGLRSLIQSFGGGDFTRVRLGVGRSEFGAGAADHVLGHFRNGETQMLQELLQRACEAVLTILCEGTKAGMNRFNSNTLTSNGGQNGRRSE
ncbi:MAG: aminoacyl-tRNA hydrolase [Desulfosarcinaceae bacterium]